MDVDLNMNEIMDIERVKLRKRLAINGIVMVVNTAEKNKTIEENNLIIETEGFLLKEEYIHELKLSLIDYNEDKTNGQDLAFKEYAEIIVKKFFKKRFMKKPIIKIINTSA